MSLVGNIAVNNADATDARSGAVRPGTGRRPSTATEDAEQHGIGLHRIRSGQSNRRPSSDAPPLPSPKHIEGKPPISEDEFTKAEDNKAIDDSADSVSTDEEDERREKQIQGLARRMTQHSSHYEDGEDVNPFNAPEGSRYDPSSPNFSAKAWVRRAMDFHRADPEAGPHRTAGIAFRNLNVFGYGTATDYQKSVGNIWLEGYGIAQRLLGKGQRRIDILRGFEGIVNPGEMLVVLGPPGSGCSTFLKTVSGEMSGLNIEDGSYINYQGIARDDMHNSFKGECIYTAEVDVHFPALTVNDTLTFAARARAPRHIPGGVSRHQWADYMRDVVMATFGISHTGNTRVGNDFIRGT
jgi:ATP-binding cassette subfamily G (WHITE) protein 2 (PDR)